MNVVKIDLNRIVSRPQVRETFDEGELQELAESLASMGQQQPIRVWWDANEGGNERYINLMGECRYLTAKMAGFRDAGNSAVVRAAYSWFFFARFVTNQADLRCTRGRSFVEKIVSIVSWVPKTFLPQTQVFREMPIFTTIFMIVAPVVCCFPLLADDESPNHAQQNAAKPELDKKLFEIDGVIPTEVRAIQRQYRKLIAVDGGDAKRRRGYEIARDISATQTMLDVLSRKWTFRDFLTLKTLSIEDPLLNDDEKQVVLLQMEAEKAFARQKEHVEKLFGRPQRFRPLMDLGLRQWIATGNLGL